MTDKNGNLSCVSCESCWSCVSCRSCKSCYFCRKCENLVHGWMCDGLKLEKKDETKYWAHNKEITKEEWDAI